MPRKTSQTRQKQTPPSILPSAKLNTCEGGAEQHELSFLHEADGYAPDIVTGGVLLPDDDGPVRLRMRPDGGRDG